MNFEQQFNQALDRQALRQNRKISPVNLAVAKLISSTALVALRDTRMNTVTNTFKVVSAPTGSSKTQSSIAFTNAMYLIDPNFTCTFVVEEIKHAHEIYLELSQEISSKDVGVWTSFHDSKKHNTEDVIKYGFEPVLATQEEVKNKRIVIYTHSKWLNEIETNKDFGVRNYKGKPRDVLFIDEQPSVIQIIEKTPADILKLRDILASNNPEHHLVSLLTDVSRRMEEVFTTKGNEMVSVDLVQFLEAYGRFTEKEALSFCRENNTGSVQLFLEGFQFLKACSMGYCFLTRSSPISFVAYLPTFKPEPNQIILDATADLSGLYPLLGGQLVEGLPSIDYTNLTINHIESPKDFKSIRAVVSNRGNAVKYANWIKQVVMDKTKAGDKILVVAHKALFATHALLPYAPQEPNDDVFPDRAVNLINWGQGIGSNQFKDCTEVFMFSEFYQPRRVTVANTLGAKNLRADVSDIHKQNGKLSGIYHDMQEGDLLRWLKQLASRGNVRNVDNEGICGKMTLHTSMDYKRLIANVQRLFPSTDSPKRTLEYIEDEPKLDIPKRRQGLTDLLSTTELKQISFKTIETLIGIKSFELRRELSASTVKPTVEAYGWTVVSSKDLAKVGKGLWIVKKNVITQ
jgi:hypothetical protein